MSRVRLELTAFRLWDWRAAYCATEAGWKPLVVSALFFGTNYFWLSGLSLSKKTAMSFDKAEGRPSNKNVPRKKQDAVKVPWNAVMIKASKVMREYKKVKNIYAPGEARTHGLQIMRLTRCLLRYRGWLKTYDCLYRYLLHKLVMLDWFICLNVCSSFSLWQKQQLVVA